MRPKWHKRIWGGLAVVALVSLAIAALLPEPVPVETARVTRGAMQVTVDEQGETRIHDRYLVSAPVTGHLERIQLHEGDEVTSRTVLATLHPVPLDIRERRELSAGVKAAEAQVREAEALVQHAESAQQQAHRTHERAIKLAADGVISREALEQSELADTTVQRQLEAARERANAASFALERAHASLLATSGQPEGMIRLRAPASGHILRIPEPSARVITAGTGIMEIGEPEQLEVIADLLSTDAVRVHAGDRLLIEGWGGSQALAGRVRYIEPSGFTKISALGVEEQRVRVVGEFLDRPSQLANGYRVEVRVVVWHSDETVKVPISSLFRSGTNWNVFVVENGRVHPRKVVIGEHNSSEAQVMNGLNPGEEIICFPGNQLSDGTRVKATGR